MGAAEAPKLRAYSLDGDPAWQLETPASGDVVGGPAYDPERGRLYAGTTAGRVVCVDAATGEVGWRQEVFGGVRAGLTIGNRSNTRDAVFVATGYSSSAGAVFALDATDGDDGRQLDVLRSGRGREPGVRPGRRRRPVLSRGPGGPRWRSDLTSEEGWRHRGLASDGETLYVTTEDGTVRAVGAPSGEGTWSYDLETVWSPSTCPSVVTDETLYVPTDAGIVALRTGETGILESRQRWRWTSDRGAGVGMQVVAARGRLYAVESANRLLALE